MGSDARCRCRGEALTAVRAQSRAAQTQCQQRLAKLPPRQRRPSSHQRRIAFSARGQRLLLGRRRRGRGPPGLAGRAADRAADRAAARRALLWQRVEGQPPTRGQPPPPPPPPPPPGASLRQDRRRGVPLAAVRAARAVGALPLPEPPVCRQPRRAPPPVQAASCPSLGVASAWPRGAAAAVAAVVAAGAVVAAAPTAAAAAGIPPATAALAPGIPPGAPGPTLVTSGSRKGTGGIVSRRDR